MNTFSNLIGKIVVLVTVLCLVGANDNHNLAQTRIIRQFPIVFGNLRRWHILDDTRINLLQTLGVACDSLIFKVADNPVRNPRRQQIQEEIAVVENQLRRRDQEPLKL